MDHWFDGARQRVLHRDDAIARLDHFRNAKGGTPTAVMRLAMQKAMQEDAAVFRTEAANPDGSDARLVLEDGTAEYAD